MTINGKDVMLLPDQSKTNTYINTKPRYMDNGNWAIPFSARFTIKSIKNFRAFKCSIDVKMKMNIRIKFTGLPNQEEVMEYAQLGKMMCIVNGDILPLM